MADNYTVRFIRYKENHDSFGKLMVSEQILKVAREAGENVVIEATALAPTSSAAEKGAGDGSHYKDHFNIAPKVVFIKGNPRAAVEVVNDANYAAQVEFGTGPGYYREGPDGEMTAGRPQGGDPGNPQRVLGRAGAKVGKYLGGPPG